jgi:biopolymer transport protein ExbD
MALSVNNGGGNGSRRRRGSSGMLAEINVTPFVDVVLVLLIIFMLTAHVMDSGLQIDVPKVRGVNNTAKDLPVISLNKNGDVYLGDKFVTLDGLKAAIEAQFGNTKAVYIRADAKTVWDAVAQVMAAAGTAGYQVNMVTQPEDSSVKGKP